MILQGGDKCFLDQVFCSCLVLHPKKGKAEEIIPILVDPAFRLEGCFRIFRKIPFRHGSSTIVEGIKYPSYAKVI
jgi:hypothetical protein